MKDGELVYLGDLGYEDVCWFGTNAELETEIERLEQVLTGRQQQKQETFDLLLLLLLLLLSFLTLTVTLTVNLTDSTRVLSALPVAHVMVQTMAIV